MPQTMRSAGYVLFGLAGGAGAADAGGWGAEGCLGSGVSR